jgi:hypothetical protein
MNHLKWVGWGVVDVEALDKQQRRNYLKKLRTELSERGYTLHPGGSTQVPWYRITKNGDVSDSKHSETIAGEGALKKICAWALVQLGEVDVSGADGSVRCAGDEAQGRVAESAVPVAPDASS